LRNFRALVISKLFYYQTLVKATSDLYDLIHSLTMNEKIYVSHSLREKEGKNHLKLFKAIEKQKTFNEAELHEIFRKEKFVSRLAVLKQYLHEYILKKLNSFHYHNSMETTLHQFLLETDILINRKLYAQAI